MPDGCDYVLRGVARGDAGADVIAVRAVAPGGAVVVAYVARDAGGLTIDDTAAGPGEPPLLTLHNVPVPAAQVFPA